MGSAMQESAARVSLVLGVARLPRQLSGEHGPSLMLELAVDTEGGLIVDVATNVNLPAYNALLREVLVGRRLADVDLCGREFAARCRCALVKPTVAALASAAAGNA